MVEVVAYLGSGYFEEDLSRGGSTPFGHRILHLHIFLIVSSFSINGFTAFTLSERIIALFP